MALLVLLPCFCGAPPFHRVPVPTHSSPNTYSLTLSGYSHPQRPLGAVRPWLKLHRGTLPTHRMWRLRGAIFIRLLKVREYFPGCSLKTDNRFSSRKLPGRLSSIYFMTMPLKFQFLKSWKVTFLALQVIHLFQLCPWGHNMRYFVRLGNTHQEYEWCQAHICSQFRAMRNMVPKKI